MSPSRPGSRPDATLREFLTAPTKKPNAILPLLALFGLALAQLLGLGMASFVRTTTLKAFTVPQFTEVLKLP